MEQERVPTKHQVAGSNPALITCKELWQTWCMRGTENPDNVVRFHEAPLMETFMISLSVETNTFAVNDQFGFSPPILY